MEFIIGLLAMLGAAIAYIFKLSGDKRRSGIELMIEKTNKELVDKRSRLRDAEIARQGAKLGYDKAKKDFNNKYGKYLDNDSGRDSAT